MRKLKHLPLEQWPLRDHEVFRAAYHPATSSTRPLDQERICRKARAR
jgi:hypothetical protein